MVSSTEHGKPKKGENEEVEEAQEAKEAADPAIADPKYMPNIIPQTGDDGGQASSAEVDSGQGPSADNPVAQPQATNPPPAKTGFEEHEEAKDGDEG